MPKSSADENFGGFDESSSKSTAKSATVSKQPKAIPKNANGLNGTGVKFALSLVTKDLSTTRVKSQLTGESAGSSDSSSEGLKIVVRDGIAKGHIVEIRTADSSGGGLGSMSCFKCGGDSSGGGNDKGFKTWTFSTQDIDYIRMTGNDSTVFAGLSGGCCASLCPCLCPSEAASASHQDRGIDIHLKYKDGSNQVVVPVRWEDEGAMASDQENCCEAWSHRDSNIKKEYLDDLTKVTTSKWSEEPSPPTCPCCSMYYQCEVACGCKKVTKSSFIKTKKYLMDADFKEHCETKNEEVISLARVLMHLMLQDR